MSGHNGHPKPTPAQEFFAEDVKEAVWVPIPKPPAVTALVQLVQHPERPATPLPGAPTCKLCLFAPTCGETGQIKLEHGYRTCKSRLIYEAEHPRLWDAANKAWAPFDDGKPYIELPPPSQAGGARGG